jgi:hypothetical protein
MGGIAAEVPDDLVKIALARIENLGIPCVYAGVRGIAQREALSAI